MPKAPVCPICGKPENAAFKPFCSQGCRDRDLLQWLGEGYRLPVGPAAEEESADPQAGLDSADNDD